MKYLLKKMVVVLAFVMVSSVLISGMVYADSNSNQAQFNKVLKLAQQKSVTDDILTDSVETNARYKQLDLPEDMVKDLTDRQLLTLVKDYPLLLISFFYSSPEQAIDTLKEVYTPFRLLINRESGKKLLLKEFSLVRERSLSKNIEIEYEFLLINVYSYAKKVDFKTAFDTIRTPKGTKVEVEKRGERLSDDKKADINRKTKKKYPRAKRISEPTTNYNCHSYALYSQSPSNKYWLYDCSAYFKDGSYSRSPSRSEADIIRWGNNEHTGIYLGWGKVKSKWGPAGVYIHPKNHSPYEQPRTFWKKQ